MSTNETLNDEITSINSIYTEDTLSPISVQDATLFSLRLPSLDSITLRIAFPTDYPDAPPSILGTQSVGDDVPKGVGSQVVDVVRDVLAKVYNPGLPCIFDLLEEVREALEKAEEQNTTLHLHDQVHDYTQTTNPTTSTTITSSNSDFTSPQHADIGPEPPWTTTPPITEKKSVFVARAAPVSSPAEAKAHIRHLLATDKKAARATHNITAWRIRGPNETSYQDCDDDGEVSIS
jgi:hypothetical protein